MTIVIALANLSLVAMVTIAAVCDARTRRIPNWLVGCGLAIALMAQIATQGLAAGGIQWLGGTATGMGLCLGIYVLGGMGAGDVKLMGAVGAFMGPLGGAHVAIVSFLAGGVLAVVAILLRKESRRAAAGVSALLLSLPFGTRVASAGQSEPGEPALACAAPRLPYAIAIAAGTLLVKWQVF
ncbi:MULTISPECIES: A24 family peptidase [unclassified Cupriavidus]|uniref:A24 family peptidase n=1 Tax=unclassified Cupriavidus TaxID=2640874 RepID=UPI000885A782|nr:prepilin peptidase [Cupriavidus sp. YR651]SDC51256.1 prepilin peptidase CpaA [Cupriavidus sp. YR651]